MITQILNILNIAFGAMFMLCYSYQVVFIVISLIKKPRKYPDTDKRFKYAFLICARNEENVIDQLCDCIRAQDYPKELIDIYVIADNCTDNTAAVAREHGATVFERHNDKLIGKGYALTEMLDKIKNSEGFDSHDGYIIVDADNILEPNYVSEMNKCFATGERIVIGYRNSKNFGDSWISAGNAVWFMRESRQLNGVRGILNTSCEVKGTGVLIHKDIFERQGGWIHHFMIEDVQFTVENVLLGEKVAYCDTAILYDEQPKGFMTSWWQRKRWCRGFLQVLWHYSGRLLKAFFKGRGFSNYDLLMCMSPAFFISLAAVGVNVIGLIATLIFSPSEFLSALLSSVYLLIGAYFLFVLVAAITVLSERKRIHAKRSSIIMSVFTFPIFMATYIPIVASALFTSTEWREIKHNRVDGSSSVSLPELSEDAEVELEKTNK